jgi:transporter family protein
MKGWLANSIVALFCFGLWAFFPKISVKYMSAKSALLYEVLGGVAVGVVVFCTLGTRAQWSLKGALPAFLTGIAGYVGFLFFLYAVEVGKVTIVSAVTAVYPVIAIILARIFLDEHIHTVHYIGIVLALIAVVLLSYP